MIELLSPVGDFEGLKAAVQNGANAVYFAAKSYGARAFANNFDMSDLEQAINYAKLRNVKTNLTLNTLIKENEFDEALEIAKNAYNYGIDAIIVQDLGLGAQLIKMFPNLDIHSSTQMTVHNLEGVKQLEKLGFKRVVLSRELPLEEIAYICKNTNIEIEVFVHGALCISYSGQCLFSSMIGGRSGNRGKCAQTCRLPFELINNSDGNFKKIDKGYILSTRDLCGLEYLPELIKAGVTSFKIEGRMKTPEYVATVTKIYRKYIDLALNGNFNISNEDKLELMQVFNRGGFSLGHLSSKENKNLIFKEKQNNMGIYLGTISKYNKNKGLVTCTVKSNLSIGDSISFENENSKYTISELMCKNDNIKNAVPNNTVTFGRMKGNINVGDKIYKIADKVLFTSAIESFSKEHIKQQLECKLNLKKNEKINVIFFCDKFSKKICYKYDYLPQIAKSSPLTKEKIISQFNKTLDTEFEFSKFEIFLDEDLFIPVSVLNDIRRMGIELIRNEILKSFKRTSILSYEKQTSRANSASTSQKIALLLNTINSNFDYTKLINVDKLYVSLKYFGDNKYLPILKYLSNNFNLYIYMPTIVRKNYVPIAKNIIKNSIETLNVKGIVISHLSQLELVSPYNNLEIVGNYTLNIYNSTSSCVCKNLQFSTITISPELDEEGILSFCNCAPISKELIVYGNIPVMTTNYCLLGKSNKCYDGCERKCLSQEKYFLKDRMGILFRVVPDNLQTISTIYNSKITSIEYNNFDVQSVRIDVLDENIDEINDIVNCVKSKGRFEGKNYTNGNLKRCI